MFWRNKKTSYICTRNSKGTLAQMVEQWTENPCVPGSIPGGTTKPTQQSGFFVSYLFTLFFNQVARYTINHLIGGGSQHLIIWCYFELLDHI